LGGVNLNKILYIVSTLRNSGPTNQLYGLIKNLDKDKFETYLLTLSPEPEDTKIGDFEKMNIDMKSLSLSRIQMIINGNSKLKKEVERINPDLIHTSGIRPDVNTNKYLSEYKHCCTIRNYAYDDYPVKFGKILGNIMAFKHIKAFKNIKYPISCSYAIKNKYKKEHDINTLVVQNGIDAIKFNPVSPSKKIELREKLDLPNHDKIFITVGSLIDRKNPLILIKAFREINNNAKLIILGDGPLFEQCSELADDNIILKGHVNNVSEYLQSSDIFVSVSKSEGLPNSVLEAMGAGLPVLLSDIEPHKEIIDRNNIIGDLFKLSNKTELTNLIDEYINLDDNVIYSKGNEARETLDNYFSAEVMSNSYQKNYKDIINGTIQENN
jgi:glycosyltransferase involved in cell wall biosynthesis